MIKTTLIRFVLKSNVKKFDRLYVMFNVEFQDECLTKSRGGEFKEFLPSTGVNVCSSSVVELRAWIVNPPYRIAKDCQVFLKGDCSGDIAYTDHEFIMHPSIGFKSISVYRTIVIESIRQYAEHFSRKPCKVRYTNAFIEIYHD